MSFKDESEFIPLDLENFTLDFWSKKGLFVWSINDPFLVHFRSYLVQMKPINFMVNFMF